MDRHTEKRHQKDIEKHRSYGEMKLRKHAGKMRRSAGAQKKEGRIERAVSEENWEEVLDEQLVAQARRRGRVSIDDLVDGLRAGAGEESTAESAEWNDAAIVIASSSGRCRVVRDGEELDCTVPSDLATRQKSALAVGDRVLVESDGEANRIGIVLPRRSALVRPDPINPHRQRLIVANVDVVVHVVSIKTPPLRPRLIDRYLIAIQRGGALPALCVNKIDLASPSELAAELAKLEPYKALGHPVVLCSTESGEGIAELRAIVQGTTCALVGHSGVGKSSILNALDASLQLAIGDLHRRGSGRHTTTSSTLHDLGGSTYVIDTPGIREFGLWNLTLATLRDYFPELAEPAVLCRFNDCTHLHEPGCEVKRLVDGGEISPARYDTYVRLAQECGAPT
ncbi:MAG TPA: ribosome small subunit-dependent GTPase A [Thermoanaerobaculia bacterium]|nr:ribosome small subunit-dependent GTPase A [Thermoanaerobaculia bacterium]